MFFSAGHFQNFVNEQCSYWDGPQRMREQYGIETRRYNAPLTLSEARAILRQVKHSIATQDWTRPGKWYRPWEVVPEIRDFKAPEGDYGVGVEVEYDFVSRAAAQQIASKIVNWKNVAIDIEGGHYGIETTFSPFLYSKMTPERQVFRYLKLLKEHEHLTRSHAPDMHMTGTHVNVSLGGERVHDWSRLDTINRVLDYDLTLAQQVKYFGRSPYGLGGDMDKYVEWKLFHSQNDWKVLRRNINIAVALTELSARDNTTRITLESVLETLETAYNK